MSAEGEGGERKGEAEGGERQSRGFGFGETQLL